MRPVAPLPRLLRELLKPAVVRRFNLEQVRHREQVLAFQMAWPGLEQDRLQ